MSGCTQTSLCNAIGYVSTDHLLCQCNVRACVICMVIMVFAYFVNLLHYLYE